MTCLSSIVLARYISTQTQQVLRPGQIEQLVPLSRRGFGAPWHFKHIDFMPKTGAHRSGLAAWRSKSACDSELSSSVGHDGWLQ